ncbi:MAG: helix-hairpin-helix domain-containing protein, partial [Chloroflexi bacterium]|nr:helix-hairpin-helix domain-containing protein [Chloroflexota bacterium]
KPVEGANDFAMMQEVLRRRFKRAISVGDGESVREPLPAAGRGRGRGEESTTQHPAPSTQYSEPTTQNTEDAGWATLPDLVIVDGGKGQLNAALEVMDDLGLANLPVVGLAKENEEIFQPGISQGLMLPRSSQALYLVQRIRDEAHRFAVTYHRKVRSKRGFGSALDEVPGIGPRRKQALIKHFGSVKAIREASLEELLGVPGMNRQAAEKIKEHL